MYFVLRGKHQISPSVLAPEGSITYSAEGTYYGPQEGQEDGAQLLFLQFGEASMSGFLDYDALNEGHARLSERGSFEKGVYRGRRVDGSTYNQDSYEAIWEEMNGRKVTYPKPRYETPVTLYPEAFSWVPSTSEPGVSSKHVGTFSERRTRLEFYSYDPGARHQTGTQGAAELHYLLRGKLSLDGQSVDVGAAIYVEHDEICTLEADVESEEFVITLPNLR